MAEEDDDLYCEQHLMMGPLDPNFSMVVIRESSIFAKDDLVVFPPINHENLQVSSSIYGVDRFLESPSGSSSSSSSSRRSDSSSSFSLLPSDSDGQSPLSACEFDRNSPSKTEGKHPPSTTFPPCDSVGNSPWKPLLREAEILRYWWELLLVRVNSKLKSLMTWFSTTLRSFYPLLAIAVWWWLRVRARRRRRGNGENIDHLRDAIKEKDERILQLLHQIAQMNELLVKDIVSRR